MSITNPFNLAGLAQIRGSTSSHWLRLLPATSDFDGAELIHPLLRGVMARQQNLQLRAENVIRNPDLMFAVASLSVVSGSLNQVTGFGQLLSANQMRELITASSGNSPFPTSSLGQDFEFNVTCLVSKWPDDYPVEPADGRVFLDAAHWNTWVEAIRAGRYLKTTNTSLNAPSNVNPVPEKGELTPWALAGLTDLNVQTGGVNTQRVNLPPAVLEVCVMLALISPQGTRCRQDITNMLVLATVILTSGGNITNGRLRKIIQNAAKETKVDNIDFTRNMVMRGWDYLSMHWPSAMTGAEYQTMFNLLEAEVKPISHHLHMLYQQTKLKLLTGIITTARAMQKFQDFPWTELGDAVRTITGVDEMENVAAFLKYIDPPPSMTPVQGMAASWKPGTGGGSWAGWEFAHRSQTQGNFRNNTFPNLLYAALQLSIQAGGNSALRSYRGTDGLTVAAKPIIDAWVATYIGVRGSGALPNLATGHMSVLVQEIMNHHV